MRIFVALSLPDAVVNRVRQVQQQAQLHDPHREIRWLPAEQIHLTLKFLGEVPEDQRPAIEQGLQRASAEARPFELILAGLGCFPNPRRPRIIWLGLGGQVEDLAALQMKVEGELKQWGRSEERAFHPHITIGRVKEGSNPRGVTKMVEAAGSGGAVSWRVEAARLFQSQLHPQGAIHTCLVSVALV